MIKMLLTKSFVVYSVDQWFPLNVRCESEVMGRCKLGSLKNDKNLSPKSPYFNTRMEKIVKNQFWMGSKWWLIN